MSVNDVACCGAEPLFFLDYFATGHLKPEEHAAIVNGIAGACKKINCALIGGETAEMPDMYAEDDFDLAGFACYPLAMLVVSPAGDVYYPCLEGGSVAGNLLEEPDLKDVGLESVFCYPYGLLGRDPLFFDQPFQVLLHGVHPQGTASCIIWAS
jgi:hypothetical protein